MKLEKFKKNKKQKQIIITTVIGILFIIGAIFLYKTHAYYEEKKTFNILQGKTPIFVENDITLSLKVNGTETQEIPSKDSGYYRVETKCDKEAIGIWNYDTWGIEVKNIKNIKINCSLNFIDAINLTDNVSIGDYVSYTPSNTSYTITSDLTGYTDTIQTLNPSELNLWRVIRKNEDGTIDMVSQYVSSTSVYFYGQTGFKNFIGTLNIIAKQYETEGITNESRYLGYNGQIENCTDATTTECPTDTLYTTDTDLVTTAIGDLIGYKVSATSTATSYFLASRYWYGSGRVHYVFPAGSIADYVANNVLVNNSEGTEYKRGDAVRPIVTLKYDIPASGSGTNDDPWKVN